MFNGRGYFKITRIQENNYELRYRGSSTIPSINGLPLYSFDSRKEAQNWLKENMGKLD